MLLEKDNKVQVSVIFVQYNSDLERILLSLYSIISQKHINLEIIVSDDNSSEDHFMEIERFFREHKFFKYTLHKNPKNVGTIKNILYGIEKSKGEYIFVNSPGDILKDENTIFEMHSYAVKHNANYIFGELIRYERRNGKCSVYLGSGPLKPKAHKWFMPKILGTYVLFGGDIPAGPTYLRKRDFAIKYFSAVAPKVKFVEDYSSTLCGAVAGERLVYFQQVVVWYESGLTKADAVVDWWQEAVNRDLIESNAIVKQLYPDSPLYDFANPKQNKLLRTIKHPWIQLNRFAYKIIPTKKFPPKDDLENEINSYFNKVLSSL